MKILIIIFFGSLALGQLFAIPVYPGVTVYAHDIILPALILYELLIPKKKAVKLPRLTQSIGIFIGVAALSLVANSWRFSGQELGISSLYLVRWILYALLY